MVSKEKQSSSQDDGVYGIGHLLVTCIVLGLILFSVSYSGQYLPPSKPVDAPPTDFSGDRARQQLEAITSIGPRPAGSHAADVETVEYLVQQLNTIKGKADPRFSIDVEVQRVSGSFAFYRNGTRFTEAVGMTSTYYNAANVLVKISPSKSTTHFILANAHFDTVPNTEGASDDTVNCAVLIEIFRAISQCDPTSMKHGMIFLFNGAEEGGLAGSHGFLQHEWFPLVKLVINLEAAGSGGQEFVFQTGPGHPWILGMYASTAKYPFTSVLAEEVFHAGIIPSDTDYRVFVQYGNLVGLDIAFVKNGYVYHTRYDDAKSIPSGSIQRAGDNVLGLIKGIVASSYLDDPDAYKHGSSVFFDVLGLFIIHYPKRLHILMNWITCGVVLLYVLSQVLRHRKYASQREHSSRLMNDSTVSILSLVSSILVILSSWILTMVFPITVAYFLTQADILMSWYTHPKYALVLYGGPALLGLLLGHFIGHQMLKRYSFVSFQSFMCAHLVIDTLILFYANLNNVSSSVFLWMWIVFPFFFVCLVLENLQLLPELKDRVRFTLHTMATIPPALMSVYHADMLFNFFAPIMGRMGDVVQSDLVMAGLTGFTVLFTLSYFANLYHSAQSKHKLLFLIGALSLLPILYTLSGRMQPYSAHDPITPKRLRLVHMKRTFHTADGAVLRRDSGVWVQPADALGITPLANIPQFQEAEEFQCDGSYCGLPYYYSIRKIFRRSWYIRGESPEGISQFTLSTNIYQREQREDGRVRFHFDIPGPDHMNLFLTLTDGVALDWSMYKSSDGQVYRTKDYMGGHTHIVFYTHGYGGQEHYTTSWKFWMEFQRSRPSNQSVPTFAELGVARHFVHGQYSRSKFLNATILSLPSWVQDTSWCSLYDSFTLA